MIHNSALRKYKMDMCDGAFVMGYCEYNHNTSVSE